MRDFKDRVAVVTGAAGGIGRATSIELARRGCHLALCDLDAEGLRSTCAEVEELGRRASSHVVDVADRRQMEAFADAVAGEYGLIHILVNNAGVTVTAPFEEHSLEDFEWIVGINFWGVVYGCKFFLPHLKRAGEGHIVNLSSIFGLFGMPAQSSYCATKFAVRGLSESLWVELRRHNIGVTSVHPAGVRTAIARSGRATRQDLKDWGIEKIEQVAMPPERAATRIVDAIERNKMRLLVHRDAYIVEAAKRLSPTLSQRLVQAFYQRFR